MTGAAAVVFVLFESGAVSSMRSGGVYIGRYASGSKRFHDGDFSAAVALVVFGMINLRLTVRQEWLKNDLYGRVGAILN